MNKKVGLSIAHYPESPGAGHMGFYEHAESIVWTGLIRGFLLDHEYEVAVAPVGRLKTKVDWLNKQNCAVVLETHFNHSSLLSVNGCETLYCPGSVKGKQFADMVHRRYAPGLDNRNRGIKEGWYRMDVPNRVDYQGDVNGNEKADYFLRKTNCPALILEPDFISQLLTITTKRFSVSMNIAIGIIHYLEREQDVPD